MIFIFFKHFQRKINDLSLYDFSSQYLFQGLNWSLFQKFKILSIMAI